MFGVEPYNSITVYDERINVANTIKSNFKKYNKKENELPDKSLLLHGDCLTELRKIPDNSIDFGFADPPYNLNKNYENWNDGIDILKYFEWCDSWLYELSRILKPGRTIAILNIPQWCVRHFKYLITILDYQDWIVWEGLSMPVRMIMPSHYSILCFTKGKPRKLPGLNLNDKSSLEMKSLTTFKEDFCSSCNKRNQFSKKEKK